VVKSFCWSSLRKTSKADGVQSLELQVRVLDVIVPEVLVPDRVATQLQPFLEVVHRGQFAGLLLVILLEQEDDTGDHGAAWLVPG
jgi:hypothetical protein